MNSISRFSFFLLLSFFAISEQYSPQATCSGAAAASLGSNYFDCRVSDPATYSATCASMKYGMWFTYTPVSTGYLKIQVDSYTGSNTDTVLQVYTGSCGSLVNAGCNDDQGYGTTPDLSSITVPMTYNQVLYILVGGFVYSPTVAGYGYFTLTAQISDQVDCYGAAIIEAGTHSFSNFGSTPDAYLTTCPSSIYMGYKMWYQYVATSSGYLTVQITSYNGNNADSVLQVYTGICSTYTTVGCNDDYGGNNLSYLRFYANYGQRYFFVIGGYSYYNIYPGSGTFTIS